MDVDLEAWLFMAVRCLEEKTASNKTGQLYIQFWQLEYEIIDP
jgi:hypothetical protein